MVYTKQDFFRDALTENLEWLTPEEIVSQIPQERIKILVELSSRRALAWRFINQRDLTADSFLHGNIVYDHHGQLGPLIKTPLPPETSPASEPIADATCGVES